MYSMSLQGRIAEHSENYVLNDTNWLHIVTHQRGGRPFLYSRIRPRLIRIWICITNSKSSSGPLASKFPSNAAFNDNILTTAFGKIAPLEMMPSHKMCVLASHKYESNYTAQLRDLSIHSSHSIDALSTRNTWESMCLSVITIVWRGGILMHSTSTLDRLFADFGIIQIYSSCIQ